VDAAIVERRSKRLGRLGKQPQICVPGNHFAIRGPLLSHMRSKSCVDPARKWRCLFASAICNGNPIIAFVMTNFYAEATFPYPWRGRKLIQSVNPNQYHASIGLGFVEQLVNWQISRDSGERHWTILNLLVFLPQYTSASWEM
jgi:hypothetical protein